MKKAKSRIRIIYVLELLGIVLFIYTANKITSHGIYADAHKTSGAISQIDITALLIALLLQVVAIGFFWSVIQSVAQQYKNNFTYKNLLHFTLWAMILGGPCMIIIPIAPLLMLAAIVLGVVALYLSYDKRSKGEAYVLDCRILSTIVLLALFVEITLSFTRT